MTETVNIQDEDYKEIEHYMPILENCIDNFGKHVKMLKDKYVTNLELIKYKIDDFKRAVGD